MIDQQRLDAETRARGILATWDQGDLAGLDAALHSAERLSAERNGLSADEEERLELLGGIAGQMRRDMAQGDIAQPETYRRLLRHLAAIPTGKLFSFPYSRCAR
jgi:hypothetical protein